MSLRIDDEDALLNDIAAQSQAAPMRAAPQAKKPIPMGWGGLSKKAKASLGKISDEAIAPSEPQVSVTLAPANYQSLPQGQPVESIDPAVIRHQKRLMQSGGLSQQPLGGKAAIESGGTDVQKESITRNIPLTPTQVQDIHDSIVAEQEFQDLKKSVKGLDEFAKQYEGMPIESPQLDLSGAMSLADFLNKGKSQFRAGYKAPESGFDIARERMKDLLALRDKAIENKRDMVKTLLAAYPAIAKSGGIAQSMAQSTEQAKAMLGQENKPQAGKAAGGVNNALEKAWGVFDKDKDVVKARDAVGSAGDARALLAQGYGPADEILKKKLITLSGDSKPSDKDVEAIGGDRRLVERFKQYVNYLFGSGSFTDLNVQEMGKLINGLERVSRQRLEGKLEGHARAAKTSQGLDPKVVKPFLMDRLSLPSPPPEAPKPPSILEMLKQRTEKKQGGK